MIEMTQCWSIHYIVDILKVSNVLPHDTILFDKWLDRRHNVGRNIVDTMKVSNVLLHDTILFDKWLDRRHNVGRYIVDTVKVSNVLPHDTILFDKWLDRRHNVGLYTILLTQWRSPMFSHMTKYYSISGLIEMTQCWSIHDMVDTMKVSNVLPPDTILFDKWLGRNDTILVHKLPKKG